jgi:hypothetical protein
MSFSASMQPLSRVSQVAGASTTVLNTQSYTNMIRLGQLYKHPAQRAIDRQWAEHLRISFDTEGTLLSQALCGVVVLENGLTRSKVVEELKKLSGCVAVQPDGSATIGYLPPTWKVLLLSGQHRVAAKGIQLWDRVMLSGPASGVVEKRAGMASFCPKLWVHLPGPFETIADEQDAEWMIQIVVPCV